MHQNRYRIDYRQNGKEYKYFIAAKNAEVAEQILMQDAQDETQPQVQQIVTYGVLYLAVNSSRMVYTPYLNNIKSMICGKKSMHHSKN